MLMMLSPKAVLCFVALSACSLAAVAQDTGVDYYVGNWTTGRNYTAWTQGKVFYLGDTLTFTVDGRDAVIQVTKDAYESCKWKLPSIPLPPVNIEWNTTVVPILGDNYYISPIEDHCTSGMKMEVQVQPPKDVYQPRNYTVGDEHGWTAGVNYSSWASGKKFYFGDVLHFVFNSSEHFVVGVLEKGYQYCNSSFYFPVGFVRLGSDGNTVVTVVPPVGPNYYVSQDDDDCDKGLKLQIEVLPSDQAPNSPAASPSATPVASPAVSPSPEGFVRQESSATLETFTSSVLFLLAVTMIIM